MAAGSAGKIYFILYLAVILELLLVIVDRDDAEEGLLRKNKEVAEAFIRLLELSDKPGASAQQDIQKYYVDAQDNGTFDLKELKQIDITLTSVSNVSILASNPIITCIKYIPTRGDEALAQKVSDSTIIARLQSAEARPLDTSVVNLDYSRITKAYFVKIPMINNNIRNTGYYEFDFSVKLNKIIFEPNKENCKIIRFGDLKVEFNLLKQYISVEKLDSDLNYIKNSVYIAIMDNTMPKPVEPPKVEVHTR